MSCLVKLPKDDGKPPKLDASLDPYTFVFPPPLTTATITIEFCDRVRASAIENQIPVLPPSSADGIDEYQNRKSLTKSTFRLHRATWVQTELCLTFPTPAIGCVSLIPLSSEETAGRFRIWLTTPNEPEPLLMWDRKVEGGFPELKVLVSLSVTVVCFYD